MGREPVVGHLLVMLGKWSDWQEDTLTFEPGPSSSLHSSSVAYTIYYTNVEQNSPASAAFWTPPFPDWCTQSCSPPGLPWPAAFSYSTNGRISRESPLRISGIVPCWSTSRASSSASCLVLRVPLPAEHDRCPNETGAYVLDSRNQILLRILEMKSLC